MSPQLSASYIIIFTIFGAFLNNFGAGEFLMAEFIGVPILTAHMFVFGLALLMDGTVLQILIAVAIGLISVYCIATAVVGYFLQPWAHLGGSHGA